MIKEYLEQYEYNNTMECLQHEINSKLISQKIDSNHKTGNIYFKKLFNNQNIFQMNF